jgi:hypothetical protein
VRRKLADCDGRVGKHRAALEAGADPVVVSGWIAEVQGERLAAERALASAQPPSGTLSPDELRELVEGLGVVAGVLGRANPKERAEVYADLGVTLTYQPERDLVEVEAVPIAACTYERVGGACRPLSTRRSCGPSYLLGRPRRAKTRRRRCCLGVTGHHHGRVNCQISQPS